MEFLRISLTDMQIFAETYSHRSFSEAAQLLFTSRQSVARGIKNIEEVLGVELFIRTPSGINATAAGDELYARCAPIIQSSFEMISYMKEYKRKQQSEIRIGLPGNIKSTRYALNVIGRFMELNPCISVHHVDLAGKNAQESLLNGETDFAFINLDINANEEFFESICLEDEEFLLIAQKDSRLTRAPEVTASVLRGERVFFLSRYRIAVQVFENWMRKSGVTEFTTVNGGDLEYIQASIIEDNGSALLLQSSANVLIRSSPELVGLHLAPKLSRHSGLLFRKEMEMTDMRRSFLDFFCREYRALSPAASDDASSAAC